MSNPFLDREQAKNKKNRVGQSVSHQRSIAQEQMLEARGRGARTPGSGNKRKKGDIEKYHGIFRVEAKCTQSRSFSVSLSMLDALEDSSLPAGEIPAVIIEFIDGAGNPIREVAVVPTYALEAIANQTDES